MKLLSLSIITYNRPKHIKEQLQYIAKDTKEKDIDIYIYDGSTNGATKKIVKKYIDEGNDHIRYFYYEDSLEKSRQRVMDAMLKPDSEYTWLCGDRFIVNPKHYDVILDHAKEKFDIITIYDTALNGTRYFEDSVKYLEYSIVPFTHFGATIVRKDILGNEIRKEFLDHFPNFARVRYLIDSISGNQFRGVTLHIKDLRINTRYSTPSLSDSKMWDVWIKEWYLMVESIPEKYGKSRENLYSILDKRMQFFTINKLLKQRAQRQFGLIKCIEYYKYVHKVVLMPYAVVLFIAALPPELAGLIEFYIQNKR